MSNYEKKIKKNMKNQKSDKKELSNTAKQINSLAKIFGAVTLIIIVVGVATYLFN